MNLPPYGALTLLAVAGGMLFWRRLWKRDPRLLTIYLGALAGAFLGAKIVYFLAEGYLHLGQPDFWRHLATGKTILGGLLGGYLAVESVKRFLRFSKATGDWFALLVPPGIILGRLGCWSAGCCQGVLCHSSWFTLRDPLGQPRWPAVPVEILFNLAALISLGWLRRTRRLPGQHFHLYLMAYGSFRFFHEFLREEPRLLFGLTGYQIAALLVMLFGWVRFRQRHRTTSPEDLILEEQRHCSAPGFAASQSAAAANSWKD